MQTVSPPSGSGTSGNGQTLPAKAGTSQNAAVRDGAALGPYNLQCGFADAKGTGCVFIDPTTKTKVATDASNVQVTSKFTDGTADNPQITTADEVDPWHFYYRIPKGKRAVLRSTTVGASVNAQQMAALQPIALNFDPPPAGKPVATVKKTTFDAKDTIIFVSKNLFSPNADFTSAKEADDLCASVATSNTSLLPTRKWKALIATSAASPDQHIGAPLGGRLVDSLNYMVGADASALLNSPDNPLLKAIGTDETGQTLADNSYVWTGTDANNAPTPEANCNSWASGAAGNGTVGTIAKDTSYLQKTVLLCSGYAHLYCVSLPNGA